MPIWNQFVDLIEWGLRFLADFTGSAGVSIILFTILIKTILLPLTIRSVRSTAAMQELQPKIRDLQKRYGQDRQKLSAEMMKLYQEYGVSPTSGCLPLLLQMPIFFGLYFAVRDLSTSGVGIWGEGFLWIPNLANPDPWHALPILAGVFQLMQTRMTRPANQPKASDPQQQMMNSMMTFMPLMVVVFGWNFAAGPVLYWAISALYSAIQQWFITGWGSLLNWFPFLPELPEHRRLGYETPEKRAARTAAARERGAGGILGALNRQVEKQIERVDADRQSDEDVPEQPGRKGARGNNRPVAPRPAPDPNLVPRKSRAGKGNRPVQDR